MTKLEELEKEKKTKEEELRALEKEIREIQLSDLKARFNLEEDNYYKIEDNDGCGTTYFYYTPANAYIKNNQLVILSSIHEFVSKAYQEVTIRGVSYYDLAPQQRVAINEGSKADSLCSTSLAVLFSKKLYGENSLKIEKASALEIASLKDNIVSQVKTF